MQSSSLKSEQCLWQARKPPLPLQVKAVSVLGLGNVALDCARILLQPPDRLKKTDIASHALQQLQNSGVERVDVIGRRGPAQVEGFQLRPLPEVPFLFLEADAAIVSAQDKLEAQYN